MLRDCQTEREQAYFQVYLQRTGDGTLPKSLRFLLQAFRQPHFPISLTLVILHANKLTCLSDFVVRLSEY
jgi:hypothetical protein